MTRKIFDRIKNIKDINKLAKELLEDEKYQKLDPSKGKHYVHNMFKLTSQEESNLIETFKLIQIN